MQLIKSIILSIVSSITNALPISYSSHITLYQNLFNTDSFDNRNLISLLNVSLIIAIIICLFKDIKSYIKKIKSIKRNIKTEKTKIKKSPNKLPTPYLNNQKDLYKNNFKYLKNILLTSILTSCIYFFLPKNTTNLKLTAFSYIITSIIIFFSSNKKGTKNHKELSYKFSFIIALSTLLCVIPTLSPLCIYLFVFSKAHFNKDITLTYSLVISLPLLFINAIPGILYFINDNTYFINNIISIVISTLISFKIIKYLKKIYSENKLYKISLYCLFLSIFILIWFR